MQKFLNILIVAVVVIVSVEMASAISCYDCDSLHDPRCNEFFCPLGVQQTDCDAAEPPQYLQKYGRSVPATGCLTRFQNGVDGQRYFVRRSCYFGDLQDITEACETEDPYVPFTKILSCHVCSEDLCNTQNKARKTFTTLKVLYTMLMVCFSIKFLL